MIKNIFGSRCLHGAVIFALTLLVLGSTSSAGMISAVLTGDARPGVPDGLKINVDVSWVDGSMDANWVVALDMAGVHDNVKLDKFYFNLAPPVGEVIAFTSILPVGWTVGVSNGTVGGGSISFDYEADGPSPPNNVTNSINLTFTSSLQNNAWSEDIFLNAVKSSSSDTAIPPGQLGAHLQALTKVVGDKTDSGFATGNYEAPPVVPEPTSIVIWGLGFLGLAGVRRKRNKA